MRWVESKQSNTSTFPLPHSCGTHSWPYTQENQLVYTHTSCSVWGTYRGHTKGVSQLATKALVQRRQQMGTFLAAGGGHHRVNTSAVGTLSTDTGGCGGRTQGGRDQQLSTQKTQTLPLNGHMHCTPSQTPPDEACSHRVQLCN